MDFRQHYIQRFALHEHLNADLLRGLRLYHLPARAPLYVQTDELTTLYFLVSGKAQVAHDHLNGKQAVLAMLTPLTVIGDLELFTDDRVTTTITTFEPCVLLGIAKPLVMRYGYDDPGFLRFIIHNLRGKLYQSGMIQVGQVFPLISRFAAYLLAGEDTQAFPPKTHLAGLLGTTVRHLNRVIERLHTEGVIQLHDHTLTILNRPQLESYTQD